MKNSHILVIVYSAVIIASVIYFGFMQHFMPTLGCFNIGGRDYSIGILDFLIIIAVIASVFLLIISLLAFSRTNDLRMLILALAFFFFSVKELLAVCENFFPGSYIYIDHMDKTLDVLIFMSFIILIYASYKGMIEKTRKKSDNVRKKSKPRARS
jgi:hypothetical protein